MFSLSTLRRTAAIALIAGSATVAATSANAAGIPVDDLVKVGTRNAAPSYTNPGTNPRTNPRTNPARTRRASRRMSPGQFFSGDWRYRTSRGTLLTFRFKANGYLFIKSSRTPGVLQAGYWRFKGNRLVLKVIGVCRSKAQGGCKRLAKPRTLNVPIRIVNKDRILADGGHMTRVRPI
jgi:hypothetical protein